MSINQEFRNGQFLGKHILTPYFSFLLILLKADSPQVVAAKGPGGGHGPVNPITGLRPSYLSSDAFGNQMPTYKNDQTNEIRRNVEPGSAKTGKRSGLKLQPSLNSASDILPKISILTLQKTSWLYLVKTELFYYLSTDLSLYFHNHIFS